MRTVFVNFIREDQGQDVIEYALLAGFISIVAITAIVSVGGTVKTLFEKVDTELTPAAGS